MIMKVFFMLAGLGIPVSILMDQEGVGMLIALLFMGIGAFFSKPRFEKD